MSTIVYDNENLGVVLEVVTENGRKDLNYFYRANPSKKHTFVGMGDELFMALKGFFQQDRDQYLGRWRSKRHPSYVVYAFTSILSVFTILDEEILATHDCSEDCDHGIWAEVREEYLKARIPTHGSVWKLTLTDGRVVNAIADSVDDFCFVTPLGDGVHLIEYESKNIYSKKRIDV